MLFNRRSSVVQTLKFAPLLPGAPRPASSPYTTRAAIRPDRRLKTSHPGGASTRRTDTEGKLHYVLQTSRNAWNRRKRPPKIRLRSRRKSSPPQLLLQARPLRPIYSPCSMKLTAAGCQRPALVLDERMASARCLRSPYPAQKRLRKNGLSDRRRVPRGDSDGRTAERCFQWATLAGLSSRIQP